MTTNPRVSKTETADALREIAAQWFDKLMSDEATEKIRDSFAHWLEQSPENRAAYEAVERGWILARRDAYDSRLLALRHETALRVTRRVARESRPRRWATAAMLLIAVGGLLGVVLWPQITPRVNAALASLGISVDGRYMTAVGERLVINLSDGSQVTLNTNSALRVAFTQSERRVLLIRGQALFEVAKNASRPFVVEAQERRFVAVGTAFDVRVEGRRIQVTMLEGTVRVERARAMEREKTIGRAPESSDAGRESGVASTRPSQVIATLTAGEQFTVDEREPAHISVADPEREISWSRGQLIFESMRLAEAVAEVNRYSEMQITLADPALSDLRISGAFATGRPAVFVEALTTYFPIDAVHTTDGMFVLSRRDGSPRRD